MKIALILISSVLGAMSYALPYLFKWSFLDDFYGIGTSISFGAILILMSIPLIKKYQYICIGIGHYLFLIGVVFGLNFISDELFKTSFIVLILTIILLCYLLYLLIQQFTH